MKDRIKTLIIEAGGYGWKTIAFDTLAGGVFGLHDRTALPLRLSGTRLGEKIAGRLRGHYANLSYVRDWRDAFCASPRLDAAVCNIHNLIAYMGAKKAMRSWPLIIILHSACGDNLFMLQKTLPWFQGRTGKLAVFIGNEYDMMAEKISLVKHLNADYICTQLPIESARWVYAECRPAHVLPLPHALNPACYFPGPDSARCLDLAFRGELYPLSIGDTDRTDLIRFVEKHGPSLGLRCEISREKFPRQEWAAFLNATKGVIGGESGTYYLDRGGTLMAEAKRFIRANPRASFEEVFSRFFSSPAVPFVSGKCISSRHFEPIGTRTCQVLIEGNYNGILKPGVHYIPVRKDLSNIDDALRQFKDEGLRRGMVQQAHEYIMDGHTYAHRVRAFLDAII